MRTQGYLSVAIVLAMSLVACSFAGSGTRMNSEQSSRSDFEDRTEVTTGEMEIQPGMIENVVTIRQMVLQTGSITITLYRPNGGVFWTRTFTAPVDTSDIIKMDLDLGVWEMKMEYQDGTGSFFINWTAHN